MFHRHPGPVQQWHRKPQQDRGPSGTGLRVLDEQRPATVDHHLQSAGEIPTLNWVRGRSAMGTVMVPIQHRDPMYMMVSLLYRGSPVCDCIGVQ